MKHLFVAVFENAESNDLVRKDNHPEGEHGKLLVRHYSTLKVNFP
jgi:hypothetical protein